QRRLTAPYRDGWYADTTKQQYDFQTTGPAPTGWSAWPVRGSVVAVQDAIGHRTDIELDRYRLLPVNVTNTAGLTILALYNLRVLQPSAVTDANGNVTQIRFSSDGFPARCWVESKPDSNGVRLGGTDTKPD